MKTNKSIKELREEIAVKSKTVAQIFEEAGDALDFSKVKCLGEGDTKGKVEKVSQLNAELADLNADYQELVKVEKSKKIASDLNAEFNNPSYVPSMPGTERKSLGQLIMETKVLREIGRTEVIDFDVKLLFQTSTGWLPEAIRIPRVELYPLRGLVVADYFPVIPTTQAAVVYMLESAPTLAAAEKAEADAYAESTFALTVTTETVKKITTSLPVTDEQLDDVPAAEAYINNRLSYDMRRRLDGQLLVGDGAGANLRGTLNATGTINTQAKGVMEPTPDTIYKAFDLIRTVGFAEPSVLFINPNDWQAIQLLRTADGIYIFGDPREVGAKTIWGIPVVQTTAMTENIALCGDYTGFAAIYLRKGLEVSMGYVGNNFTEGKKTLRADMRCAVVHFRAKAFCSITGI